MAYLVVGLGEVLWDMLPSGKQLGGAPANFAYHARELGGAAVRSEVVSAVGDDGAGREIRETLAALGLGDRYLASVPDRPTGSVEVAYAEGAGHTFDIREAVAWDAIPDVPVLAELAGHADVVCFGSLAQRSEISRETIRAFLSRVRPGVLRIFDINLRQHHYSEAVIVASLDAADVLKLNDEDDLTVLSSMIGLDREPEQAARELAARYGLRLVVLTRGGAGSLIYAREQDRFSRHGGCDAVGGCVDTVGAGDSFTAALAVGLLLGRDLDTINEDANRVAAFVCTRAGATPQLPAEIKARFAQP